MRINWKRNLQITHGSLSRWISGPGPVMIALLTTESYELFVKSQAPKSTGVGAAPQLHGQSEPAGKAQTAVFRIGTIHTIF